MTHVKSRVPGRAASPVFAARLRLVMRLLFIASVAAACVALATPAARAQGQPLTPPTPQESFYRRAAEPPASAWDSAGFLGLEVEARGGFMFPESGSPVLAPNLYPSSIAGNATGDILEGRESPYAYDPFAVSFAVGYRFLPFLSAGVFFDYASFQVKDGTDTGDYIDTTSQ